MPIVGLAQSWRGRLVSRLGQASLAAMTQDMSRDDVYVVKTGSFCRRGAPAISRDRCRGLTPITQVGPAAIVGLLRVGPESSTTPAVERRRLK
jgi:hypothetical protein